MEQPPAIAALFANAPHASTARLAAAYLLVCRDRARELANLAGARMQLEPGFGTDVGRVEIAAARVPAASVHSRAENAATWAIAEQLAAACRDADAESGHFVLACRIAAELLDHACGRYFALALRSDRVEVGDPIPNIAANLRAIFETGAKLISSRVTFAGRARASCISIHSGSIQNLSVTKMLAGYMRGTYSAYILQGSGS